MIRCCYASGLQLRVVCDLVMNPPIHSMPPSSYQQHATPMYPLKPKEVPTIPNNYTDGHGTATVYPPVAGYPPAQAPGKYCISLVAFIINNPINPICLNSFTIKSRSARMHLEKNLTSRTDFYRPRHEACDVSVSIANSK